MADIKKIESVAAYIRVSTQEQKLHGLSLDAQQMKLQEYADKNNMKIVEWYMDKGVSGRKPIKKRPELQRMITDAGKGLFERIIFIKIDRFFRSVAEYHECMKRISPVVWSTTEEKYDLTTANGRMFVNMKLTIAELEADQTGERIRLVNDYKVQVGRPLVGDRCLPFGFRNYVDESAGMKRVCRDKENEHIVYDLLDHFFKNQSVQKAMVYVQDKYNIRLWYESASKLLKNPMLCGEYRGNKNYCEAYISREKFDRLQDLLKRQTKNNSTREYIFAGLLRCPSCGIVMSGCPHATTKPNGTKYVYNKYRCNNRYVQSICDFKKFVNQNVLERKLLDEVEVFLKKAQLDARKVGGHQEKADSKKMLENLKAQVTRLNYSWQTGKILDVAQYEKQYAELIGKIEELEKVRPIEKKKDYKHIEKILYDGWQDSYLKLSEKNKKAFWRSFIKKIVVNWTTDVKEIAEIEFL